MNENRDKITNKKSQAILPALAMRDLVIYPGMIMHFDVARPFSVNAMKEAIKGNGHIFLVTQRDMFVENPTQKDVYSVGVVSEIKQIIKTPDNITRVLVEGLYKAKVINFDNSTEKMLWAEVKRTVNTSKYDKEDNEIVALVRMIKASFGEYATVMPKMPKELIHAVVNENDPGKLYENVAFNITMSTESRQKLLEMSNIKDKLTFIINTLVDETELLKIEKDIAKKVNENIDKNQREYFLREQLKVVQSQLGEGDDVINDAYELMDKIDELKLDASISDKLYSEANRLLRMPANSQEANVVRTYLETVLALPWNKKSKEKKDIANAGAILDKDHYGLKKVKERILENFAVRSLTPDIKGQIICLVGPPGVGKTSIGKSIARAMGRKYVRVSLGGVKDESEIRGHRKTYVGSMPGRIINAINLAGTRNPVILLDEIDKMSNDFRGDPASAMLEVLDPEQNATFRDHYIEVPFDLSDVLFITTANTLDTISAPLLDRMDIIELSSYTREEKFNICKKHLISKQLAKNGLKASICKITDPVIYTLIDSYTREAGVRKLEKCVATLCRKAAKDIVTDGIKKVIFTNDNIESYLGTKKYHPDLFMSYDDIGIVNGLAWTSVGGVIMPLEVMILDGKGEVIITGSLGDVMKESAKIAVSYCRSVAEKYNIQGDFYTKKDIHIHAPEGAVPKDGPSAGVTLVTGLISALSSIPVRSDVAMTGEITLHGKVLPIGGLREKTMAAYKAGIKTVIVPKENQPDMDEVDVVVKASLNFVFASTLDDVLKVALVHSSEDKSQNQYVENLITQAQIEQTVNC